MQLETRRLTLRGWQPAQDARHAMDIYGDRQVIDWIDDGSQDQSIRQVEGRLHRYMNSVKLSHHCAGSWAVEQKDIGRLIGHVMLIEMPEMEAANTHPVAPDDSIDSTDNSPEISADYIEIGWHFRPASWGFGYATEAAFCIAQYGFDKLKLPLLLAVIDPKNKRSTAVAERLGMCYDGITTRYYGGRELFLYKLTAQDLAAAQARQALSVP
ncbi:MAG: GNAT family N-acetyltransferase [Phormidesmis sp.]